MPSIKFKCVVILDEKKNMQEKARNGEIDE